MCSGCDQKISFESFKILLIVEEGVLGYVAFVTLLEGKELIGTLIGLVPGVLLGFPQYPVLDTELVFWLES